ncbi:hypothetical protein [Nocardiopsis metallicus]|uniref:Uncharacterized protein n=1 Tax=Nocardiopsis metallicus TaxID=179819 RepID=A0A840WI33_9ACTN|nr:hypothetical protein [Nocardiopsis metallicus]MBB5491146.1 hypothetical protein [Nocardiopsis metallicus]
MRRPPTLTAAVPALILALLLTAVPAPAAAQESVNAAQVIADSLTRSPVHVDPAYASALPEDVREETASLIEASDLPLYVIAVPLAEGDTWNGDSETLTSLVHDRMGAGRAHYLVFDNGRMRGQDFGSDHHSPAHFASLTSSYATEFSANPRELVEVSVQTALSDDPEGAFTSARDAYEEQREDLPDPEPPAPGTDGRQAEDGAGPPGWSWPAIVALALLLAAGLAWRARRARVPSLPALAVTQHAGFDNADRAELDRLVERGANDLVELGERLGRLRAEPRGEEANRLLQHALDARAAAARVHDRMLATEPALPDAVGVLVLLDMAEDAILRSRARSRKPRAHCYANPLHGTSTRRTEWREFGGTRSVRVPLCSECAQAVRDRSRPRVLPARYRGSEVPYYEVPADESVWAATGYGALRDDLVERVLRGDHSGSRR